MAPVKFADLEKTAKATLNDDFQVDGYQLKAKQTTAWNSAVLSTTVDVPSATEGHWTPAKLSFKLPKLPGVNGFVVDKLEMDKSGKFWLEANCDHGLHTVKDLKVDLKSDLAGRAGVTAGVTYTGVKDTQVKLDVKPAKPDTATLEATRGFGAVTAGLMIAQKPSAKDASDPKKALSVDLGASLKSGDLFAAIIARNSLGVVDLWSAYNMDKVTLCGTCQLAQSAEKGKYAVAVAYKPNDGTTLKAKTDQDRNLFLSLKHAVEKGFTAVLGAKLKLKDPTKMDFTWGAQLIIE